MSGEQHIGLECKAYWCNKLLDSSKTVELRQYPLPKELLGKRIWLLASGGEDGVAALADTVEAGCKAAHIVGWVSFIAVITYTCFADWKAHFGLHCVDEDSPYAFGIGGANCIYGWLVGHRHRLQSPQPLPDMTRIKRSLFEMLTAPTELD